jgi:Ribbon-helix-helix domain
MGRINVELPDELDKKLRFKSIEKFGGKKGDLSRAIEDAVKQWVTPEQNQ